MNGRDARGGDPVSLVPAHAEVFWRHGYSAPSIDELTTAMGLSRFSMYKRFQDKDGLFQVSTRSPKLPLTRMREAVGENLDRPLAGQRS